MQRCIDLLDNRCIVFDPKSYMLANLVRLFEQTFRGKVFKSEVLSYLFPIFYTQQQFLFYQS